MSTTSDQHEFAQLFPQTLLEPWLAGDLRGARDAAAWIYAHFAGEAFRGYLERGRGCLAGPFVDTQAIPLPDDVEPLILPDGTRLELPTLDTQAARAEYVVPGEPRFDALFRDPFDRARVARAIKTYNVAREVTLILLFRDRPVFFAVGAPHRELTPRGLYEFTTGQPAPAGVVGREPLVWDEDTFTVAVGGLH